MMKKSIPKELSSHESASFLANASTAPDDFFGFCKKISPKEFEQIMKEGQLIQYEPGTTVYLQGDLSDSFYVISDGKIEIVKTNEQGEDPMPITHLSKGDIFGEVGLLVNGPRTASARVTGSSTLLRFDKKGFQRLISTIPLFGHYLSLVLARRLQKTTLQLHFFRNVRELSGSLDFFDLPTIFQTISLSQQHGVMHVFSDTNEVIGEFTFSGGNPISGRYMHLEGIDSFLQLFQTTPKTSFGFTRMNESPVIETPLKIQNVNEFIMHAIHLRDEMLVLEQKLHLSEDQPLKRIHARLEWKFEDFQECAKKIWQALMKEPVPLKDLCSSMPYCRYDILLVLDRLFTTEQISFAEITPYGYR